MNKIKFSLEGGAFTTSVRDKKSATDVSADVTPNHGAGSLWNVKGGSFQFRNSTDMAISQATVKYPTQAPTANEPTEESLEVVPETALTRFYAKPMHLDPTAGDKPISSVLNVTVRSQDGKPVPNFQIQYIRKDVPASVWGPYSPSHDPNITRSITTKVLEDLPTTMNLAMAISLHSPRPQLERSRIPDFNATAMAKLEVPRAVHRNDQDEMIVDHWVLPDTEDLQTDFLPTFVDAADADRANDVKWEAIRSKWIDSYNKDLVSGKVVEGGDTDGGMLGLFQSALGWEESLVGGVPGRLVGGKKGEGLIRYYLGLPRLTTGV